MRSSLGPAATLAGYEPRNGAFPSAEIGRQESRASNHRFMEKQGGLFSPVLASGIWIAGGSVDRVHVKLVHTDVERGFIDFARD